MDTDPAATLGSITNTTNDDKGVLVAVRQALDVDTAVDTRCRALEQLDEMGIALDSVVLRQLLADHDATVARYVLGLISLSADRVTLVEEAAATPHANEPAFREDLHLLREML